MRYTFFKMFILKIRFWIIKILFTDDEKYLLIRAIEDRIDNLERIAVKEVWADKYSIYADCSDYKKLKEIFSTRDWM